MGEIRYSRLEVERIFEKLRKKDIYTPLFCCDSSLHGEILKEVTEFLQGLGKSDFLGQTEYCQMYAEKFKNNALSKEGEVRKKAGLYTSLSCLAGAAVSIIIL